MFELLLFNSLNNTQIIYLLINSNEHFVDVNPLIYYRIINKLFLLNKQIMLIRNDNESFDVSWFYYIF